MRRVCSGGASGGMTTGVVDGFRGLGEEVGVDVGEKSWDLWERRRCSLEWAVRITWGEILCSREGLRVGILCVGLVVSFEGFREWRMTVSRDD